MRPLTSGEYIAAFRAKLAACKTAAQIIPLWQDETEARRAAGIAPNSFVEQQLWFAYHDALGEILAMCEKEDAKA